MAEKNLPIKFFQKRQKDEQTTEAGGGDSTPKWVSNDIGFLSTRVKGFRTYFSSISTKLEQKVCNDNYLPSIIKIKLINDALAKSYRSDISDIFDVGNKLNIIGIDGEGELLVKIDSLNDLKLINRKFDSPIKNRVAISAISEIEDYEPEINLDLKKDKILKIKLFNYQDIDLNNMLVRAFEEYCKQKNISFHSGRYSKDLNIYRIGNVTIDELNELKCFDGVLSIGAMPIYSVSADNLEEAPEISVKQPLKGKIYPTVGVLDTGIAKNTHLAPWVLDESSTDYIEEDINKSHGTFVAGVLLYGDELEGKPYIGLDGCKIFDATVFPDISKQMIYEDELIEHIKNVINRNSHIKIWNLSLGTDQEADLDDFSDFAIELDKVQEQHNVLICKSAGNCNNFRKNAPRSRIAKSADTVRGLVVGSIAHDKKTNDLSDVNHPSPFTRVGPGPSYIIKPDIVHYGGNVSADGQITGVKSFSIDDKVIKNAGTSFSTPRITALAAGLDNMLNEEFDPNLLKALIIHSAKYPEEMKMDIANKIKLAGFGLPANAKDILFNEPNEITLILQDTIEKGTFINILDFPYPKSMVDENGYYYGEITVTLVTSPVLAPSQKSEYCQSNIDVLFGSYDTKKERDVTKKTIKNPIGAEGNKNLLRDELYSKKFKNDVDSTFAKERVLLAYGKKFQPVKKWVVNFDEFTPSNREKYLKSPKQWELKLTGLFRNFTEIKSARDREEPSQEFCLIITIKDTKKKGNIYNEVTQLLDNHSFIHSNVKIKEEVRIRLNG
jgi:hypothetical protein